MTEHELQNAIIDLIRLRGGVVVRVNSGTAIFKKGEVTNVIRGAARGTSDLLCCFGGKFLAIEVKVGRNKLSMEQIEFGRQVRDAGGLFLAAYDLDAVINVLNTIEGKVKGA